jgi:3-dehydroquinate dehydratase-2
VAKRRLLLLNGPNLDRLGQREPEIYGSTTLAAVEASLSALASELGASLDCFQSNHEGELIDRIHGSVGAGVEGILINPGGLGHGSVSLRDAFLSAEIPFVELHCSNVHAREEFRRHSVLADVAVGSISGFGAASYELALRAILKHLE